MKDLTTEDRRNALVRLRKRRAYILKVHPDWRLSLSDNIVLIDALERLILLNLGEKPSEKKSQ